MSPKIKGIDYNELLKIADSVAPGARLKNIVKSGFRFLFGESYGNGLIEFVKKQRNRNSRVWPLSAGQK